ncbi:MAG: hypothetical protein SFW67_26310 [Myxococcaceae bacterium]|nr:hypothetical protein [Myxococcaceae bacterium]
MSVHDLFDVSVLFETPDAARGAYSRIFGASPTNAQVSFGELTLISSVTDSPMPAGDLDLRLCPKGQSIGGAWIGLKLGVLDAFSMNAMGAKADPFRDGGRMREASKLVASLLAAGGFAVVLHKAALLVKPASLFLYELRDPASPEVRPWAAWLDFIASHDGRAFECRSFGMPHFFGSPNVRVVLDAPSADSFALERAMQATKYAVALLAADGSMAELPAQLEVPVGWYPGPRAPPPPRGTTIPWTTRSTDDGLTVELSCPEFERSHLARAFDEAPASLPFDVYCRGLEEALLRAFAPELSMKDVLRFSAPPGSPEVALLVFDREDGLTVLVTAGFGRVRAASGDPGLATEYAEFCIAVPSDDPRFFRPLLTLGALSLTTPAAGGIKDFDGFPPGEDGRGFVVMPLEDVSLARKRALALRQFVPVTADEYAGYRTLDGPSRKAWIDQRLRGWRDAANRWR